MLGFALYISHQHCKYNLHIALQNSYISAVFFFKFAKTVFYNLLHYKYFFPLKFNYRFFFKPPNTARENISYTFSELISSLLINSGFISKFMYISSFSEEKLWL